MSINFEQKVGVSQGASNPSGELGIFQKPGVGLEAKRTHRLATGGFFNPSTVDAGWGGRGLVPCTMDV